MPTCPICKTVVIGREFDHSLSTAPDHRECVLKGLEMNLFQSVKEWEKACKPKKSIRKVLVEK
jgi:hypothetical protein